MVRVIISFGRYAEHRVPFAVIYHSVFRCASLISGTSVKRVKLRGDTFPPVTIADDCLFAWHADVLPIFYLMTAICILSELNFKNAYPLF